jgi:hypothetical protein
MDFIKKNFFSQSAATRVALLIVMAVAICYIGFMGGKFAWYIFH